MSVDGEALLKSGRCNDTGLLGEGVDHVKLALEAIRGDVRVEHFHAIDDKVTLGNLGTRCGSSSVALDQCSRHSRPADRSLLKPSAATSMFVPGDVKRGIAGFKANNAAVGRLKLQETTKGEFGCQNV